MLKSSGDNEIWDVVVCKRFQRAWGHLGNLEKLRAGGNHGSLSSRMTATAKHGATDPRDKVYALLVICDFPDHDPVQPDYSKTKHQVFAQATMAMIRDFTGYLYLDIPFRSLRSKNRPRTPAPSTLNPSIPNAQDPSVRLSWVFDFAIASQTQHSSQSHDYNHPASFIPQRLRVGVGYDMSTAPSLHFFPDSSTMYITGVPLGTITATFHGFWDCRVASGTFGTNFLRTPSSTSTTVSANPTIFHRRISSTRSRLKTQLSISIHRTSILSHPSATRDPRLSSK
jgi:hypothetical protein